MFDDPASEIGLPKPTWDVVIVGGGPAGLSAALLLGRCRRTVLVLDSGRPRNECAQHMHGFLSRDGTPPAAFRDLARHDVLQYPTVELRDACVADVQPYESGFLVLMEGGGREVCRRLLLATGVVDHIPKIEGLKELYGCSVHHCPICDGWEWRDHPIAVYGMGSRGYGSVLEMTAWSRDLVLLTDGPCDLDRKQLAHLKSVRIPIDERKIVRLEGENGRLRRIVFDDGGIRARDALFFSTGNTQRSDLAERLGCRMDKKGCIWTTTGEKSSVRNVFVAGDASKNAQLVIVAAAEGALAAVAINRSLTADYKASKEPEETQG